MPLLKLCRRAGAHLPGFDDSAWNVSSPMDGLSSAGVAVYRTTFSLNIPVDMDVPLGIQVTLTPSSNFRGNIFVNGWQFGRFISNIGPQSIFPVRVFLWNCFVLFTDDEPSR